MRALLADLAAKTNPDGAWGVFMRGLSSGHPDCRN
jgi:hypothetical protein